MPPLSYYEHVSKQCLRTRLVASTSRCLGWIYMKMVIQARMLGTIEMGLTSLLGCNNSSTCSMNIACVQRSRHCHGPALHLRWQQWFVDTLFPKSFSFILASIPIIYQLCFRVNFSFIEWKAFIMMVWKGLDIIHHTFAYYKQKWVSAWSTMTGILFLQNVSKPPLYITWV